MSRFEEQIQLALMHSARERRLVAYHRCDQEPGFFCVGWFLRFEEGEAIFRDVPKDVFSDEEVVVSLQEIEWIQTDTPYLRGLEQLYVGGEAIATGMDGRLYTELEYVETLLRDAWESGRVIEIALEDDEFNCAQVLDVDQDAALIQEFFLDDASAMGTRWCRIPSIWAVRAHSSQCLKLEALLGMPARSEFQVER